MASDTTATETTIQSIDRPSPSPKRTFKTPEQHGESFFDPSPERLPSVWERNLLLSENTSPVLIGGISLDALRRLARTDLIQKAVAYSRKYCDVPDPLLAPADSIRILMVGHQPELFHPGIWFKNFVASRFASEVQAVAINMIVDHDLCIARSIRVPQQTDSGTHAILDVPFDRSTSPIPFEEATINDLEPFRSFGSRVSELAQSFAAHPVIDRLWPEVLAAEARLGNTDSSSDEGSDGSSEALSRANLGQVLAAGRHRLEHQLGLTTLEVPMSQLADSEGFTRLVWHIAADARRFLDVHNTQLAEFRKLHGLRDKARPVPPLEQRDEWTEIPFWVWQATGRHRKKLFVRHAGQSVIMSDLDGWNCEVDLTRGVERLRELNLAGLKIRPRAITTTLYSRLVLSDLFIHGIGGGKYDQFTDQLAQVYFGAELPEFYVVSATYKLPLAQTEVRESEIVEIKQRMRELDSHPERLLTERLGALPSEIGAIIEQKRLWTSGQAAGTGAEKHRAISECNQKLKEWAAPLRAELEQRLVSLTKQIEANQILGSREYSFCLFPNELLEM